MTPRGWFRELFYIARERGIEAFSSVFDVEGLAFLESIGCPRYKIASFEIGDIELLAAVARTNKPIVFSTGMATYKEIADAAFAITEWQKNLGAFTILKCTSAYPASIGDANLRTMLDLSEHLRPLGWPGVGLSDHTLGSTVAIAATALGATMIEKHLTLLRSDGGPDAAFSMEPDEFAAMVTACREAAQAIGTIHYGPTASELPQAQLKGRTVAARNAENTEGR